VKITASRGNLNAWRGKFARAPDPLNVSHREIDDIARLPDEAARHICATARQSDGTARLPGAATCHAAAQPAVQRRAMTLGFLHAGFG
jgi:hypothetical protein